MNTENLGPKRKLREAGRSRGKCWTTVAPSVRGLTWKSVGSIRARFVVCVFTAATLGLTVPAYASCITATLCLRPEGTTYRVSVDQNGSQSNGRSSGPSISADGNWIAFVSTASNLVPGDTNGTWDAFLVEWRSRTIERISVGPAGQGNGPSYGTHVSADGEFVVFSSAANNLDIDDNNNTDDVFLYERATGHLELVSIGHGGTEANARSLFPKVSENGRFVLFYSEASNLITDDTNAKSDWFVRDSLLSTTIRISVGLNGVQGNRAVGNSADMSGNGRYIAFESYASNLVPEDANSLRDIFVRDLLLGTTSLVSVGVDGSSASGPVPPLVPGGYNKDASISDNGRYVAFRSISQDVVPRDEVEEAAYYASYGLLFDADTGPEFDTYVRDLETGTTTRESVDAAGHREPRGTFSPVISSDGRYVLYFRGHYDNCCSSTGTYYLRDRLNKTTERVSVAKEPTDPDIFFAYPYPPDWDLYQSGDLSADSRYVTFGFVAQNLVDDDTNNLPDIFVRDRSPQQ